MKGVHPAISQSVWVCMVSILLTALMNISPLYLAKTLEASRWPLRVMAELLRGHAHNTTLTKMVFAYAHHL